MKLLCLLINHEAVGELLVRLEMNYCLWIVTVYFWVIILLLNHPDAVQLRPKRRYTLRYGKWQVNIVKI
jgi:hypothetical protein